MPISGRLAECAMVQLQKGRRRSLYNAANTHPRIYCEGKNEVQDSWCSMPLKGKNEDVWKIKTKAKEDGYLHRKRLETEARSL